MQALRGWGPEPVEGRMAVCVAAGPEPASWAVRLLAFGNARPTCACTLCYRNTNGERPPQRRAMANVMTKESSRLLWCQGSGSSGEDDGRWSHLPPLTGPAATKVVPWGNMDGSSSRRFSFSFETNYKCRFLCEMP